MQSLGLNKEQRIAEFDIAKGIAILCVILGHMGNPYVDRVVYVFHMPLFFLISGYFLSAKGSYSFFVKRKFASLIIPYLFSCLLIILTFLLVFYIWGYEARRGLLGWIVAAIYGAGSPMNYPLDRIGHIGAIWFLLALFWSVCIVRYLQPLRDPVSFVVICLISFVGYETAQSIWLPFSIQAGMFASFYVYLGWMVCKNILPPPPPTALPGNTATAVISLFLILTVLWDIVYYKGLYMSYCFLGNGLMDVIASLCACYLILAICSKVKLVPVLSNILLFYGKNSLIVLSIHIVEQSIVPWTLLIRGLNTNLSNVQTFSIIVFLKIVVVTFVTVVVLQIPFLREVYRGNVWLLDQNHKSPQL